MPMPDIPLIPRPKEFVSRKPIPVRSRTSVAIILPKRADLLLKQGAEELRELIARRYRVGVTCDVGPNPRSAIVVALDNADSRRCPRGMKIPHHPQGYCVHPTRSPSGLVIAGRTPLGAYYGVQTLKGLIDIASSRAFPQADVTDWPDLDQRGVWLEPQYGEMPFWGEHQWRRLIDWMAGVKMNFLELLTVMWEGFRYRPTRFAALIDPGPPVLTREGFLRDLIAYARARAVTIAPVIIHLEQWTALVDAHPEVRGTVRRGYKLPNRDCRPICFSKPAALRLLTEVIADVLDNLDPDALSVWLTEESSNAVCMCPRCSRGNPYVREARIAYKAFKRAQQGRRRARLHLLLTQGSEGTNSEVIRSLPADVKWDFYSGLTTYIADTNVPMVPPEMEALGSKGYRISVVPTLGQLHPFSYKHWLPLPGFIRRRMVELADKGMSALTGRGGEMPLDYNINMAAGAEFSWNARGRQTRAFVEAWAYRHDRKSWRRRAEFYDLVSEPIRRICVESNYLSFYDLQAFFESFKGRWNNGPASTYLFLSSWTRAHKMEVLLERFERAAAIARDLGDDRLEEEALFMLHLVTAYSRMLKLGYSHRMLAGLKKLLSHEIPGSRGHALLWAKRTRQELRSAEKALAQLHALWRRISRQRVYKKAEEPFKWVRDKLEKAKPKILAMARQFAGRRPSIPRARSPRKRSRRS